MSQNPYESPSDINASKTRPRIRLDRTTLACCGYYLLSALSLPFASKIWLGEVPVFALFQMPKIFLKSVVHDALTFGVNALGWSKGSPSLDYSMIHSWAMIGMLTLPVIALLGLNVAFRSEKARTAKTVVILTCAGIDAAVTLTVDALSKTKFFNASVF